MDSISSRKKNCNLESHSALFRIFLHSAHRILTHTQMPGCFMCCATAGEKSELSGSLAEADESSPGTGLAPKDRETLLGSSVAFGREQSFPI